MLENIVSHSGTNMTGDVVGTPPDFSLTLGFLFYFISFFILPLECGLAAETQRRGRPKTREIDRDTVLKINRHRRHRSADNIWPPRRVGDDFNFHQQVHAAHKKSESSSADRQRSQQYHHHQYQHPQQQSRKISNSTDNISIDTQRVGVAVCEASFSPPPNITSDGSGGGSCERKISQLHIWPPLCDHNERKSKKFYLPDEKIHSGDVDELIKHRFGDDDGSSGSSGGKTKKQNHEMEEIECAHGRADGIESVPGKRRLISLGPIECIVLLLSVLCPLCRK